MSGGFDINYAVVSAFERSKQQRGRSGSGRTFTVILMAVFFIVLMIGLATGVTLYQKVARAQDEANGLHMQTGLLANTVRVNDAVDTVALGAGPEGDALVLVQRLESGMYEMRIYRHQGYIVQEYAISGRDYNPQNAQQLVESGTFEFSFNDGLLTILTDDGTFDVALRSSQAGAPVVQSEGAVRAGLASASPQEGRGGAR